ncbi:MAG: hypothetical protein IKF80_03570 [Erysipelotrichaceae bacterium]|nr:hypothetical protein [Erysipelotrichaceae bacterium]
MMIEKIIDRIGYDYPLKEKDIAEFKTFKAGSLNNECEAYDAKNMGNIFAMASKAMLGLMKVETLVICPFDIDGPILTLDAVNGKNIYIDLIDATLEKSYSEKRTLAVKDKYNEFLQGDQKAKWDDKFRLRSSMIAKFPDSRKAEECVMEMIEAYLKMLDETHVCYSGDKKKKIREYTDELLENGGPATDVFLKQLGREKTERFFNEAMFATE